MVWFINTNVKLLIHLISTHYLWTEILCNNTNIQNTAASHVWLLTSFLYFSNSSLKVPEPFRPTKHDIADRNIFFIIRLSIYHLADISDTM